jgi:hypothetical protein
MKGKWILGKDNENTLRARSVREIPDQKSFHSFTVI